jgi:hypothetical protein
MSEHRLQTAVRALRRIAKSEIDGVRGRRRQLMRWEIIQIARAACRDLGVTDFNRPIDEAGNPAGERYVDLWRENERREAAAGTES